MRITRSPRLRIRRDPKFWSVHTHSRYSAEDALPTVEEIVGRVSSMGQKALGLTDHGNMAGSVELYKACSKAGIAPFPGSELYYVPDTDRHKLARKTKDGVKASRFHLGVVAYTTEGYENLVRLSTLSHENHFHKPLVDDQMLSQLSEDGHLKGLAVTTGCFFGYTVQQLITKGEDSAAAVLSTLNSWFPDSTYVEIQNHEIGHNEEWNDDEVADALVSIADRLSLPVVMTQDSHYVDPGDKALHETLKKLVAFGDDPDDAVFPGDGFHLADDTWMKEHHPGRWDRGIEGLQDLLSKHTLEIPVLDKYTYSVPRVVVDPRTLMEERCRKELASRNLGKKYLAQLEEEFDVINSADMAGYMVLVAQVTDWLQENDVVFQTRGSAAGSLVCWLLGITQVDPIKWDLRFHRFLSRDRTKPPDIDLDIAHDRREELIQWLDSRFTARQIGSWMKYSLITDEDDESSGSLLVKYFSTANKTGSEYHAFDDIPEEDQDLLRGLSDQEPYKGMGVNAAGVVLTSTPTEFDKLVPLAHRNSGGFVSQYHLKSIEDMGLVKLDVLGSKTLTVLKQCMDNLDQPLSNLLDIPLNDRATYRTISSGETAGIFQLEGNSSKWGSKSLKPEKIADVIAAMALFRPGPQSAQADKHYIKRKHKQEPLPDRHELIQSITAPTYGVMLYQEQVIDLLRKLGMGADDLTAFLKAVKASNSNIGDAAKVIASYQEWITERCAELNMSTEDKEFLDESIAGFAEYGFNRCVFGETTIRVYGEDMSTYPDTAMRRASKNTKTDSFEITVKEYYDIYNGIPCPTRSKYRSAKGLLIAAHSDGRIKLDKVVRPMYQGKQRVYTTTTESGHSITTTDNHRHLTQRGWVMVKDLVIGEDMLATMGEYEHKPAWKSALKDNFYGPMGLDTVREIYASIPPYCERCGEYEGRLEVAHLDHDRTNNTRENLQRLCNSCHKKHDYDTGARVKRWEKGRPIVWSKVTSVDYYGEEDTYDLEMAGEDHSWVGNGIVTHNSHATVYGLTAYRCAWLATHHPVEFHAALLAVAASTPKEAHYLRATRARGVKVLQPSLDVSGATYTVDKKLGVIRKGLLSIDGVGFKSAEVLAANAPYRNLDDLVERSPSRPISGGKNYDGTPESLNGVLGKLRDAGVLELLIARQ